MVTRIESAQSCAAEDWTSYDGDLNVENLMEIAGRNGKAIRDCYEGMPEARSERLRFEFRNAKSTLESNPQFRCLAEPTKQDALEGLQFVVFGRRDDTVTQWISKGLLTVAMGIYFGAVAIGLGMMPLIPGTGKVPEA